MEKPASASDSEVVQPRDLHGSRGRIGRPGVYGYGSSAIITLAVVLVIYPLSMGPVARLHGNFVVPGLADEEVYVSRMPPFTSMTKPRGKFDVLERIYQPLVWACRQNSTADAWMRQYLEYWGQYYVVMWFPSKTSGTPSGPYLIAPAPTGMWD